MTSPSTSQKATARFTITSWNETTSVDIDGEGTSIREAYYPKRGFTHATVEKAYTGDLVGTSRLDYLIAYKDGDAPVLGLERFVGTLDGREGSFVLRHDGGQDAGSVHAHLTVVSGMGTGDLADLQGEAELAIAGESDDGYELVLIYYLG